MDGKDWEGARSRPAPSDESAASSPDGDGAADRAASAPPNGDDVDRDAVAEQAERAAPPNDVAPAAADDPPADAPEGDGPASAPDESDDGPGVDADETSTPDASGTPPTSAPPEATTTPPRPEPGTAGTPPAATTPGSEASPAAPAARDATAETGETHEPAPEPSPLSLRPPPDPVPESEPPPASDQPGVATGPDTTVSGAASTASAVPAEDAERAAPSGSATVEPVPPPIFDLPDGDALATGPPSGSPEAPATETPGQGTAVQNHRRVPTLGVPTPHSGTRAVGDTGPHTPPDQQTVADEPRHLKPRSASDNGGPLRRPRWSLVATLTPLVIVGLILIAWAVDTAALSGQVQRNVEVAGRQIGGIGEASLPELMADISEEVAGRPVRLVTGDTTYETTAGELGLTLDETRTAEDALDAGRRDALPLRPIKWVQSFFSAREVPIRYTVSQTKVADKLLELQGVARTDPVEPTIKLQDGSFTLVPGTPGTGFDVERLVDGLPTAAAGSTRGEIVIPVDPAPIAPRSSDEDAQALADRANEVTAKGVNLTAADVTVNVPVPQLRDWIGPIVNEGELQLAINGDKVKAALPAMFSQLAAKPQDATFSIQGGQVVIGPSRPGAVCCAEQSAKTIWDSLKDGTTDVELQVQTTQPRLSAEAAQKLRITRPIGGNHAWQNGAATTAGPGFTTYHNAGEARVTNIHRIADLVRGAVILPGETFSINERVGPRTLDKGFVEAGAIRNGQHVDEVGGGVSQFATTTFNAAYFAGLDILTYQAHTESFPRYPPGREATMGYPSPDVVIRNNTPYGVLIWTSYTGSSITVTMYSTPYATADQTGISESPSDQCRVVTTTRTRRYPDGTTENDTFRATYRPGPGIGCNGQPLPPVPD